MTPRWPGWCGGPGRFKKTGGSAEPGRSVELSLMVADSNIVKVVVSFKGCSELHLTSVKKRFCHLN